MSQMKALKQENTILLTIDQKNLRDVVDKRRTVFEKYYTQHTMQTQYYQVTKKEEYLINDEQIKSCESFIYRLIGKYREYFKALVRADGIKYKTLLNLFQSEEKLQELASDQDRYNLLTLMEPFDYMGITKSYTMFL